MTEQKAEIQHIGRHARRLVNNPSERAFAEQWQHENRITGYTTPVLDDLLGRRPTQEEATASATVIQWLGSRVGWNFLEQAMEHCGYVLRRRAR